MATSAPGSFEFDHDYAKSSAGQLHREVNDQTKVCTVEFFLSFWAPAKQIATNGSLCPLSVCSTVRLSCYAFAGNTCSVEHWFGKQLTVYMLLYRYFHLQQCHSTTMYMYTCTGVVHVVVYMHISIGL